MREGALTKADIVRLIAQGTGLTKTDTAAVVDGFLESVIEALERGEHIEIRGFGTFKVLQKQARVGRNPKNGTVYEISKRKVVPDRGRPVTIMGAAGSGISLFAANL